MSTSWSLRLGNAFFVLGVVCSGAAGAGEETRGAPVRVLESPGELAKALERIDGAFIGGALRPNYHALVIAISHYGHPDWYGLQGYPIIEGSDLARILKEKYDFEVTTLLGTNATARAINDEIRRFSTQLAESDALLVYFSGHGTEDRVKNLSYWIPYDGASFRDGTKRNWISNEQVMEPLERSRARHVLLISDSCFARGFAPRKPPQDPFIAYSKLMLERPSRYAVVSSTNETPAASPFAAGLIAYLSKQSQTTNLFDAEQLACEVNKVCRKEMHWGPLTENTKPVPGVFVFVPKGCSVERSPPAIVASEGTKTDGVHVAWLRYRDASAYRLRRRDTVASATDAMLKGATKGVKVALLAGGISDTHNALGCVDLGAQPGNIYFYYVEALNAAGNVICTSDLALGFVPPPPPPQGFVWVQMPNGGYWDRDHTSGIWVGTNLVAGMTGATPQAMATYCSTNLLSTGLKGWVVRMPAEEEYQAYKNHSLVSKGKEVVTKGTNPAIVAIDWKEQAKVIFRSRPARDSGTLVGFRLVIAPISEPLSQTVGTAD